MSPRFYTQYASNFNTLASIFVCSLAFLSVFLLTLALSAFRFKEIIFYSASSRSADTQRENFRDLVRISCEEGESCIASKSVRSSMMYLFFKPRNFPLFHFLGTIAFFNNMISYRICTKYMYLLYLLYFEDKSRFLLIFK